MSSRTFLLLALAALALVTPVPIHAWEMKDAGLERVSVPIESHPIPTRTSADLDQDGALETLVLTHGRAVIQSGDETRWQSSETWDVQQAMISDLNRDDLPEATLLVWRPFKPWPVDTWLPSGGRIDDFHDARGMSCQIILVGWYQGAFRERWAGSALAAPVDRFAVADLKGDGRHYLIALEGKYDDPPWAPSHFLKVWEWNGFGFSVVYEMPGSFSLVTATQTQ
ncbi:MAG TPA: hypothetical protein VFO91_16270, partial [Anaerolineales bacterium]|nr:hypothetical protein [Anaerolineales bacterium]